MSKTVLLPSWAKKGQPFVTLTIKISSNFLFKVINFIFDFFLGISPDCQQPSPLEQFKRFQSITEGMHAHCLPNYSVILDGGKIKLTI